MSHEREPEQFRPVLALEPDEPNFPEVTGTTLPLLSGLLAGFAVTITVQLIMEPAVAGDRRLVVAITAFLLSVLFFLSSTVFAINAQANNYLRFLDLAPAGRRLLNVGNVSDWMWRMERRWHVYYVAALFAFYGGLVPLLAGIDLVILAFMGGPAALLFAAAVIANLALTLLVFWLSRRASRARPR